MERAKPEVPQWAKDVKKAMIDVGMRGPSELARMLGRNRVYITNVLNGRYWPSDELRDSICGVLRKRLDEIGLPSAHLDIY